jgi:hypothetical protein
MEIKIKNISNQRVSLPSPLPTLGKGVEIVTDINPKEFYIIKNDLDRLINAGLIDLVSIELLGSYSNKFTLDDNNGAIKYEGSSIAGGGEGDVPASRILTANSPITGGGDLSADRSFSLNQSALNPVNMSSTGATPGDVATATLGGGIAWTTPASGSADETRTIYVGKHGNNSDDGKNIGKAKLTINAAITAASALTPSVSAPVVIRVLDAGIYTENVTLPSYVSLDAKNAVLEPLSSAPTLALNGGCFASIAEVRQSNTNQEAITMASGSSGTGQVNVDRIVATGFATAVGALSASALLLLKATEIETTCKGIMPTTTGAIHMDVERIALKGNGAYGVLEAYGAQITGRIGILAERGVVTGTVGISGSAGLLTLVIGTLQADTPYDVPFGNTFNAFITQVLGTPSIVGTANVTIAGTSAGGDVVGPASSTDNALAVFDGLTGKLLQNSSITLSGAGLSNMTFPAISTLNLPTNGFSNSVKIGNSGIGGANSIGAGALSSTQANGTAYGYNARAQATGAIAIGYNNNVTGNYGLAIGYSQTVSAGGGTAIGYQAGVTGGAYGLAAGYSASVTVNDGIAIGRLATVSHAGAMAFGYSAASTAISRATFGDNSTNIMEIQCGGGLAVWFGTPPGSQPTKISDPSGGTVIDAEARTAINTIIDALESYNLTSPT